MSFIIYLTINTSQVAWRTTFSETLPIKKRSTALTPVAPITIKSTFSSGTSSFVRTNLGNPLFKMILISVTLASCAFFS